MQSELSLREERRIKTAGADRRPLAFLISHSAAGGAQEIWANIAAAFQRRGYPVTLMALYPFEASVRQPSADLPWTYVADKRPTSPAGQVKMFLSLVNFLKREKPAVVFTALPAANVLAAAAAKMAGHDVKVVTSHHSPSQTYNPALNLVDGLTGRLSSVKSIVSVSNAVKASHDGKSAAYQRKRRTIHNALPPDVERHLAELAAQYDRSAPRGRKVVATGRLHPQKNYPVLIRAAQHMPDVEIEIVGAGPDEAELKALAKELGVESRINFLGFMSRTDALKRLAAGDVFAQPSLYEGHSLALVEAAKIGLPLVVSDVPVQVEGITGADGEPCGIAVGVHDDRALAAALTKLLDDPKVYKDYAERAARLGEHATFNVMIDAYEGMVA